MDVGRFPRLRGDFPDCGGGRMIGQGEDPASGNLPLRIEVPMSGGVRSGHKEGLRGWCKTCRWFRTALRG